MRIAHSKATGLPDLADDRSVIMLHVRAVCVCLCVRACVCVCVLGLGWCCCCLLNLLLNAVFLGSWFLVLGPVACFCCSFSIFHSAFVCACVHVMSKLKLHVGLGWIVIWLFRVPLSLQMAMGGHSAGIGMSDLHFARRCCRRRCKRLTY